MKNKIIVTTIHTDHTMSRLEVSFADIFGYYKRLISMNPKVLDVKGRTVLHAAVLSEMQDIVRPIIGKIDINVKDDDGDTPLIAAVSIYSIAMAEILLQNGTDVDMSNNNMISPLHVACGEDERTAMVMLLLGYGADIDIRDENKNTPLHLAVVNNGTDVIDVLLKNNASSIFNSSGCMPIHLAAENGHTSAIRLLLDSGIDIDTRTENGHTSLYIAIVNDQLETVKYLLDRGSNPDVMTLNGRLYLNNIDSEMRQFLQEKSVCSFEADTN